MVKSYSHRGRGVWRFWDRKKKTNANDGFLIPRGNQENQTAQGRKNKEKKVTLRASSQGLFSREHHFLLVTVITMIGLSIDGQVS